MTDNPCNCESCDKATFTRGKNFTNSGVLCGGKEILPDGVATIKEKGCLSHHRAREVLMKDVIEEIERRIGRLGTYPDKTQALRTYKATLALLRGCEQE